MEDGVIMMFGVEKQEGESARWRDLGIRRCRPSPGGTVGFLLIIPSLILVVLPLNSYKKQSAEEMVEII